jgi:hypothetical protein
MAVYRLDHRVTGVASTQRLENNAARTGRNARVESDRVGAQVARNHVDTRRWVLATPVTRWSRRYTAIAPRA